MFLYEENGRNADPLKKVPRSCVSGLTVPKEGGTPKQGRPRLMVKGNFKKEVGGDNLEHVFLQKPLETNENQTTPIKTYRKHTENL